MLTFNEIGLNPRLIEGLNKVGIVQPTEIQAGVIPLALRNKNVIGQSQTGSGKTLAYLLPLFEKIQSDKRELQAIILAPTHELAMQINFEIKRLSGNSGVPVASVPIIGDVNIVRQIEALREKPHIVVGSVGRIQELIGKKKINAQTIKTIVIDEGDRLLSQNDINRVKAVIKATMRDRQLMVFAAHFSNKALVAAKELIDNVEIVKTKEKNLVNTDITHHYVIAQSQRDKLEVLRKLMAAFKIERAIVFINNEEYIERTTEKLHYHHYKAYKIFGRVSKEERQRAIEGFRGEGTRLLIASDIAARGLDVKGVTHVFNLDLPEDSREYLNRVGRTGRNGQKGTAVSIVTERELPIVRQLEKELKIKIEKRGVFKGAIVSGNRPPFKKKSVTKSQVKQKH
ncbi:DEAD/DEAH box helicase [Desulforamulus aquiferis]|nr:DEAD/DEAH box helicase [Desulforamulus aquiferis]